MLVKIITWRFIVVNIMTLFLSFDFRIIRKDFFLIILLISAYSQYWLLIFSKLSYL